MRTIQAILDINSIDHSKIEAWLSENLEKAKYDCIMFQNEVDLRQAQGRAKVLDELVYIFREAQHLRDIAQKNKIEEVHSNAEPGAY